MSQKRRLFLLFFASFLILGATASAADPAGEIFGKPVSKAEFDFAYKTQGIFSMAGTSFTDETARRQETWEYLILLKEAERRGVQVPREEVLKELGRLLSEKEIQYGSFEYHQFVRTNFQEDSKVFEQRLEQLLRVKKLLAMTSTPEGGSVSEILKSANLRDNEQPTPRVQKKGEETMVTIETNQGTFEVKLFNDVAPKAVENFTKLAEKGFYNGTVFHRVIEGFMIQGGDPTATGRGGESVWGRPFEDEVKRDVQFDRAGILAMANAGPSTNGSQFFITLAPTPHLNMRHTIFGEVSSGMDVVKKIGSTSVDRSDKPASDQKIVRMTVKK
jgi:peptidylprolyl isomerase